MKIFSINNVKNNIEKKENKLGGWIIICLVWLVFWQLISMLVDNTLLLPSPKETVVSLGQLLGESVFYLDVLWTIMRCMLAMLMSFVAGFFLAWLSYLKPWVRKILILPTSFFKAVPVMAIIIYVILVVTANWVSIVVCFFMCFPIVYANILSGLDQTDMELLELAYVYKFPTSQVFKYIYLPSIYPNIRTAIGLIVGLSWKAVVAAEVLSIPKYSLGYEMINAKYYLDTPKLFAYIIVIVALSLMFEAFIKRLLKGLSWKEYSKNKIKARAEAPSEACSDVRSELHSEACSKVHSEPHSEACSKVRSEPHSEACSDVRSELHFEACSKERSEKSGGLWEIGKTSPVEKPVLTDKLEEIGKAPTVKLSNITKFYEDEKVFENLSISFEGGKVTSLMAPSGRGKTTLLRIIVGLENYQGHVDISENARIAYLFQEDRLLPWLNVYDNLAISMLGSCERPSSNISHKETCGTKVFRKEISDTKISHKEVLDMAEALELTECLDKLPNQLSGGMKHRVAIGRTLLSKGNLLILDEPFRGLDKELKRRIVNRLWEKETKGKTVILVSHNSEDSKSLADKELRL